MQDGEDNCGDYYVSKEKMQELLDLCKKVLENSKLIDGVIQNGSTFSKDTEPKLIPIWETGKTIENPEVARELLPVTDGFFFGGTDYDQYYMEDIELTIDILEEALKDKALNEFYYHSSW